MPQKPITCTTHSNEAAIRRSTRYLNEDPSRQCNAINNSCNSEVIRDHRMLATFWYVAVTFSIPWKQQKVNHVNHLFFSFFFFHYTYATASQQTTVVCALSLNLHESGTRETALHSLTQRWARVQNFDRSKKKKFLLPHQKCTVLYKKTLML